MRYFTDLDIDYIQHAIGRAAHRNELKIIHEFLYPVLKKRAMLPRTYVDQITAKKNLKDAQAFVARMIDKGYDAYIQKAVFDTNEIWYRVRVGSYDKYNAATTASKAISKELNFSTWVDFVRLEQ